MNTVASTEKPNSLEQDKQVNPQQSQFTSPDVNRSNHQLRLFHSLIHKRLAKKKLSLQM